MTVANVNVTKVLFKRGNTVQNNNYTGVSGEITIDTQAKTLRIHDGSTVGGNIITATLTGNAGSQQAAIDSLNANVGAYQIYANANATTQTVSINSINANLGAFQTVSNSNAAAQATSINSINANLGAFQSYANITLSTIANAASQESAINSINANVGAYQIFANANASSQTTEINSLRANITAANAAITSLQSNAAVQAALLDTLTGNAATQSQVLDTLTTNAATQATTLTTLLSNAVAQQTSLIDLVANAATQAQFISNTNANTKSYLAAFDGNIIPAANVTYSLGDATHQWKDLWVSNNTIYIGNTPIRVDGGRLLVNNTPVADTVSNLTNGTATLQLFANGQVITDDVVFASNGVSIINANGVIQGGMYNSGDADWLNIGATTGRGIKFYVDEEAEGPLFFANGSVNVPNVLYSDSGVIGDVGMYGGTIWNNNPNYNYLNVTAQVEGYTYVQLPTDATANVSNVRISNGIGNIEISTGDGISYNYNYFTKDGELKLSNGLWFDVMGAINATAGTAIFQSTGYDLRLRANTDGAMQEWSFGSDGNLIIPGNINYANGVSILSGIGGAVNGNIVVGDSQIQFVANSSGDGYGLSTIRLVPYTAGYDSAIIIIDPTYPNHIHMRAGFEQDNAAANLFLGGEASHFNVEEGANPNVSIRSNYYTWTFGTDGTLTLPGGYTLGEPGGPSIRLQAPNTTDTIQLNWANEVSFTLGNTGAANIAQIGTFGGYWNFDDYGNLTIPGSITMDAGSSRLISVVTPEPGLVSWEFGMDGNLTVPGNIVDSNGASILANYATISSTLNSTYTSQSTNDFAGGNYYNADTLSVEYTAYTGASTLNVNIGYQKPLDGYIGINVAAVSTPLIQSLGNIVMTSNTGGVESSWLFGTDGTLTFPTGGNLTFDSSAVSIIDGVTNINAVGTIGANVIQVLDSITTFGASPAPVIYGFRSISTTGSAANEGNISASGNLVASQNAYVTGDVFAARYNFANGVNILSTVGAGSYGNTEVAAYLPTYTGNIGAGNVNVTSTVYAANIVTSGTSGNISGVNVISANTFVFAANGVNILSVAGGTYGNTEVAAYLLTWPNVDSNILDATSANITTLRAPNFNSANAVISGGYISALTNASIITATITTLNSTGGNITTLRATNFGTANAVITGGYINSLANLTATTAVLTNLSTGNAVISGGYISALTNAYITTSAITNFSTANAVITGGYASGLANVTATGNVTAGNLIGYGSNTSIIAGAYTSTFDNVGNVILPNVFVSGNTTAMGIAAGYAPNRPAFRVYGNGAVPIWHNTANVNLKGSAIAVDHNQGNYFNSTNGKFTAPVSGLYMTTLQARVGDNNGLNQIAVLKNGNNSGANVVCFWETDTNTGTATHFGTSGVVLLSPGDFLSANILAGNINFDGNDSWTVTYLG